MGNFQCASPRKILKIPWCLGKYGLGKIEQVSTVEHEIMKYY